MLNYIKDTANQTIGTSVGGMLGNLAAGQKVNPLKASLFGLADSLIDFIKNRYINWGLYDDKNDWYKKSYIGLVDVDSYINSDNLNYGFSDNYFTNLLNLSSSNIILRGILGGLYDGSLKGIGAGALTGIPLVGKPLASKLYLNSYLPGLGAEIGKQTSKIHNMIDVNDYINNKIDSGINNINNSIKEYNNIDLSDSSTLKEINNLKYQKNKLENLKNDKIKYIIAHSLLKY